MGPACSQADQDLGALESGAEAVLQACPGRQRLGYLSTPTATWQAFGLESNNKKLGLVGLLQFIFPSN